MALIKVLMILTSGYDLKGHPTGTWIEEVATPYYAFKEAGFEVTQVSMKGGPVPIDVASMQGDFFTPPAKKFLWDAEAMAAFEHTKALKDVNVLEYDAIFIPGGHGTCVDEHKDAPDMKQAVETMYAAGNKIVSAVCHGPGAFIECKKPNGEPLVKGLEVCGFSNSEEAAVNLQNLVPYSLEDEFKKAGGLYQKVADWHSIAVRDGNLITGQNPQSSEAVAILVIEALKE